MHGWHFRGGFAWGFCADGSRGGHEEAQKASLSLTWGQSGTLRKCDHAFLSCSHLADLESIAGGSGILLLLCDSSMMAKMLSWVRRIDWDSRSPGYVG